MKGNFLSPKYFNIVSGDKRSFFMGKYDTVVNLFTKTQNLLKTTGKTGVLSTRPVKNFNIEGLTYARKMVGDTCTFRGDRTLCPSFLDDLMKLDDADNIKFATAVRDRMLMAMGYSSPEKMKVLSEVNPAFNMTFNFTNGTLKVGDLSCLSKAEKIACLRHELDHFDRAAQLYKAVGGKKYAEALTKRSPHELVVVDHNFWCQMSKNADIDGFDVNRFLSSWENPRFIKVSSSQDFACVRKSHYYATDVFEASAYGKQKQIQRALGLNDKVLADSLGKPLGNIIRHLDDLGVPDERKMQIYTELSMAAQFKFSKNSTILMKNYQNIINGNVDDGLKLAASDLPKYLNDNDTFVLMKNIENWINQGCYSIDDILAKGLV